MDKFSIKKTIKSKVLNIAYELSYLLLNLRVFTFIGKFKEKQPFLNDVIP